MSFRPSTEPRDRWLWLTCLAAFVIGLGYGAWKIRPGTPLPVSQTIVQPVGLDQLALAHPVGPVRRPEKPPGSLRFRLYSSDGLEDPWLAEEVHPIAFDLGTPWLTKLLKQQPKAPENAFFFRLSGQICFTTAVTEMHIKCDDSYRLTLRDAQGHQTHLDSWGGDVTRDFTFVVKAEPGCYEIDIDYANMSGDAYFDLWPTAGEVGFFPAETRPVAP